MNKTFKIVVLLLVLGGASFAITTVVLNVINANARKAKNAPDTMPEFGFIQTNGPVFEKENLSKDRPTAFVFYSPGCEHCIVQGSEIGHNIDALQGIDLLFVTNESREQVSEYSEAFGLHNASNVVFLYDDMNTIYTSFNPDIFPTILIYSSNGQLIKGWSGNVTAEEIIAAVRSH